MPEPITPELIQKAVRGSQQAFRAIVEANQGFVYAVAFRFVNDEQDAEDLTQEIFVRLWKNLHTYKQEVKLTTWLYKIVTNQCLDFLKSRHGRQRKNKVDIDRSHFVQDHSTPEKEFQQQELSRILHAAAEELTPKQKAVFILRDLEGLSQEEVSEALSMSTGNVKSNLFYARQKMTEKLKAWYQTTDKQFL
jgi:RNA polymerase sigma-70 factor (ECF subfamily)